MAKSPAPFSGSAVRSMTKGWTRLANPSPAILRMRMALDLFPRCRKGTQVNFPWRHLVAGDEGPGEEIERIDVLELGRCRNGDIAGELRSATAHDLGGRRHPDREAAGNLVDLAPDPRRSAIDLDGDVDERPELGCELRI